MPKKKPVRKAKKAAKPKSKKLVRAKKVKAAKVIGIVDHFFDKISVAAIKLKAPLKVGDAIHFKGHTTDFVQTVGSIQIEHEQFEKAKKGDDIGIKVRDKVRQHDKVLVPEQPVKQAAPAPLVRSVPAPSLPPAAAKPTGSDYSGIKFLKF
jgi:hypothetical protein